MPAPAYDVDFYSDEFIRDPWPHYAAMRALGPVVWLPRHGNYALTRHREVSECLRDPETFRSGRGVAADKIACDLMQGNSIASDGERHAAIRVAMAGPLLPGALEDVRPLIEALAEDLVERLAVQGPFDAVSDLAAHLPLTVVRDLVGLPDFGKDNMLRWGAAAFDLLGVQNARGRKALETFLEQREFIRQHATRDALKEGSWTRRIHELVDQGALSAELAPFCIRDYINPSLDTTISATGQLVWQLSRNPDQWDLLRARPELAAGAVNEAVRLGSPIRSFSRHAARDVRYGGHVVEKGARVMVLYASANRDERAFPDPDRFDVTRNPKLHLGFGSGVHMCVGMHLAQLEMTALLRAMAPRVRRIRTGEPTVALNNTIYGFGSLPTEFEREAAGTRPAVAPGPAAPAGAVRRHPAPLRARVAERRPVAEGVVCLTLVGAEGDLPAWRPGAHVDLHVRPGLVRQYSLTGPFEAGTYRIAVQREAASAGGSAAVHERLREGASVLVGHPRNTFPVEEDAAESLLFSGGIGITPILAMAWRLHELGRPFCWHLSVRTRARLPFADELPGLPFAERIVFHVGEEGRRLDPDAALGRAGPGCHVYLCGPPGYMAAVEAAARRRGIGADRVHREHFGAEIDVTGAPFVVEAVLSGRTVEVGADETILAALQRSGIHVETACRTGVCGSCLTEVVEGRPDHRDMVLTDGEKAANDRIAVCCSRSKTRVLRLAL